MTHTQVARVKILEATQDFTLATWQHLFVAVVRGRAVESLIRDMHHHMRALSRSEPGGIGFILVKEAGSGIPEGSARKLAHDMFRDLAPCFLGVAGVVEGTGFWAAATRSVMAIATRMGQQQFPFRIFASTREGAAWQAIVLSRPGRRITTEVLMGVIAEARGALDAPVQRASGFGA